MKAKHVVAFLRSNSYQTSLEGDEGFYEPYRLPSSAKEEREPQIRGWALRSLFTKNYLSNFTSVGYSNVSFLYVFLCTFYAQTRWIWVQQNARMHCNKVRDSSTFCKHIKQTFFGILLKRIAKFLPSIHVYMYLLRIQIGKFIDKQ